MSCVAKIVQIQDKGQSTLTMRAIFYGMFSESLNEKLVLFYGGR